MSDPCHRGHWPRRVMAALSIIILLLPGPGRAETPLAQRHTPSGLNDQLTFSGATFADYIATQRQMIGAARRSLDPQTPQMVIDGNSPFMLAPEAGCGPARAVLMIHGLTDSPYWLRPLADVFRQQCFHVYTILLPGHGTRPGDLTRVGWEDWDAAVRLGIRLAAQQHHELYLLGYSLGGTLAILQATRRPAPGTPAIKGLILFAPALHIDAQAIITRFHGLWDWLLPRQAWLDIAPDVDPFKYESFPMNAAAQIHRLTWELDDHLDDNVPQLPLFIALSEQDRTVDSAATLQFFARNRHPASRLLLYSNAAPTLSDPRIVLQDSRDAARHIVSSAHTALLLPPEEPHYGAAGDYVLCNHYLDQLPLWQRCRQRDEDVLGEISTDTLQQGVVRRLSYNPWYTSMLDQLRTFIATSEQQIGSTRMLKKAVHGLFQPAKQKL
ncbi:MAG: alpha/beta fold hydrolase [Gammaproteobacteria bacterium]|nr:alpha/beta fold hydrolase [Gammaproteobacteria bacterium]